MISGWHFSRVDPVLSLVASLGNANARLQLVEPVEIAAESASEAKAAEAAADAKPGDAKSEDKKADGEGKGDAKEPPPKWGVVAGNLVRALGPAGVSRCMRFCASGIALAGADVCWMRSSFVRNCPRAARRSPNKTPTSRRYFSSILAASRSR